MVEMMNKINQSLKSSPIERLADYADEIMTSIPACFTSQDLNQLVCTVPIGESAGMIGETQFSQTPIASYMEVDNVKSKRCPAALNPFDPRIQKRQHPLKHSLGKYFRGSVEGFEPSRM